jgi:ADP-ribose pyrophosphatase
MSERFRWVDIETVHREVLPSAHGDELRWLVNRERIRDTATGRTIVRSIIRHPGICLMVPVLADGRIVLVRQYRYPLDALLWELPAGTLPGREEAGRMVGLETPEVCAVRELREEAGYEADEWEKVAEYCAMPGGNDQIVHVFLARRLTRVGQALEDGEIITEVRAFEPTAIEGMIRRGEIRDAKTLIGLFYALGRRARGVRLA